MLLTAMTLGWRWDRIAGARSSRWTQYLGLTSWRRDRAADEAERIAGRWQQGCRAWTPPCGMITSWNQVLMKPIEQSWLACRSGFFGVSGEAQEAFETGISGGGDRDNVYLVVESAVGPAFGVKVDSMPGLDQVPAEVGDVGLGATLLSGQLAESSGPGACFASFSPSHDTVIRHAPIIVLSHPDGSGFSH